MTSFHVLIIYGVERELSKKDKKNIQKTSLSLLEVHVDPINTMSVGLT